MPSPENLSEYAWWVLLGSIAATYLWRGLGVALASRINPEGRAFRWITCVSYAMLAGLISRMVIFPVGPLTDVHALLRVGGIVLGVCLFFLFGKRVLPAVLVTLLVFGFATTL